MKIAYLFPGQGSQSIGMCKDFFNEFSYVRERFEAADDALKFNLSKLIFEGDESELQLTQNAQPAILTSSIAVLDVIQNESDFKASVVAGHSLGEYSALVAAGSMSFMDAVLTVRQRGIYMQGCVPVGTGSMAAILGAEDAQVEAACEKISKQGHLVEPANYNCPGQLVVSGHTKAVAELCEVLKSEGVKRCIPLKVSAPFHSSLLQAAGEKLRENDLNRIKLHDLKIPYYANVDANFYNESEGILDRLEQQVSSSVKWKQSLEKMVSQQHVEGVLEVGPGTVTSGHMKKVNKDIHNFSTNTLENTLKALKHIGI